MTRRRYIQDPDTLELIEVTQDYRQTPMNHDAALWNDRGYDGMRATDGTDISSRSKHREYMKRNGLTTVDDYNGSWDRAKKERENYFTRGGSFRKQDIERAMYEVNNRKK